MYVCMCVCVHISGHYLAIILFLFSFLLHLRGLMLKVICFLVNVLDVSKWWSSDVGWMLAGGGVVMLA